MSYHDGNPPPLIVPPLPDAPRSTHPPRILFLYGSLRERSFSRLAAEEAARIMEGLGAEVRWFHSHELPLRDPAMLEGGFFDVQGCNDTNRVDLFVFASDTQALVMARLDNLGKGASGAAVQAMNVHIGVDEALGL